MELVNLSESQEIDIDSLEAGMILDRLVAIEVMKWKPWKEQWLRGPSGKTYYIAKQEEHNAVYFRPSTDISAAWEVVEKFINPLIIRQLPRDNGGWRCNFRESTGSDRIDSQFDAYASTAPLAICRAALKAVKNATV